MNWSVLRQPYPFTPYHETFRRNLFFSSFVAIFLLLFKPFGLDVYSYEQSYIIIGYGVVLFACLSINELIAYRFFKSSFEEANWTVGKQITWAFYQLFVAGMACFLYAVAIDAFPANLTSFFKIELYVLLCSVTPITIIVLIRQNYLLKNNLKEAAILNQDVSLVHGLDAHLAKGTITFKGDNQNELLQLESDAVYYISSQDNYYEVVWMQQDKLSKSLLRGTLSKVESLLSTYPHFLRCHRAFIVNLSKVQSVEGNAQGYRLRLKNTDDIIPVARGKGQHLQQGLRAIQ